MEWPTTSRSRAEELQIPPPLWSLFSPLSIWGRVAIVRAVVSEAKFLPDFEKPRLTSSPFTSEPRP
jgi:hypothetical protein